MKDKNKNLRMTVRNDETNHHQSVFRPARELWAVLTETAEIQGKLKQDGVQMKFYPCFTEV